MKTTTKTTTLSRLFRALPVALALAAAPVVAPVAAQAQMEMKTGAEVTLGPLQISGGFSRATLPNAPVGGGFMTITNTGTEDDTLIGASSPVAGHMEVHEMAMQGDVMKMRELTDGLPIPAGQTVVLKPGGFHVMFMGLKQPLVEGETIMVTLKFAKAGEVEVPLVVGPVNAGAKGMMNMNGAKSGMNMNDSTGGNRIDNNMIQPQAPGADAPASMG